MIRSPKTLFVINKLKTPDVLKSVIHNVFYRYNIRMNKWESVCSMHSHRSYAVAGVVGGEVIVVGGYNGSINLATVEKYNPVSDSWSMLSMLGSPRR